MSPRTEQLIELALDEDIGLGDLTSRAIFDPDHQSSGFIGAGQDLVVCGADVAARVFHRVDPSISASILVPDGRLVRTGTKIMALKGNTVALLTAERTALNFIQRLSGIATLSRKFADAVAGTGVRVVDTRKTTPGFRALEKEAVRCGGCSNHRSSLGEHVLIKDNHIAAAGSLEKAVKRARAAAPHSAKIEVEAKTLAEVRQALRASAEVILLDNMSPAEIRGAVAVIAGRCLVEVSGGVRLENVRDYAIPGVDVISVGALTHSAPSVDLSLTILPGRVGHKKSRRSAKR